VGGALSRFSYGYIFQLARMTACTILSMQKEKGQCHEIFDFRQFATGIIDTGGKFAKVAAQQVF
jgi:hypothetical protein